MLNTNCRDKYTLNMYIIKMIYIVLREVCMDYLIHMRFRTCRLVYLLITSNIRYLLSVLYLHPIVAIRYETLSDISTTTDI